MTFRMVADNPTDGGNGGQSNVDWDAFNNHKEAQIEAAIEESGGNQICILSGIVDAGVQPPNEEYSEYPYEGSERQEKLLVNDQVDCYVEDGKFYIANRPAQAVIFTVDFPEIMINYGKFFNKEGEDDWKPYRAIIGGEFKGIAAVTSITPNKADGYGAKSRINKLAKAMGLYKTNPPADFDLAELLGGEFCMTVETKRGGDQNQYLNIITKNISPKDKRLPSPDHDIKPFGVMMAGGNEEADLKLVNKTMQRRLEMAVGWKDSALKAELEGLRQSGNSDTTEKKEEKPKGKTAGNKATDAKKQQQQAKKTGKKPAPAPKEDIEFDDDIPF